MIQLFESPSWIAALVELFTKKAYCCFEEEFEGLMKYLTCLYFEDYKILIFVLSIEKSANFMKSF